LPLALYFDECVDGRVAAGLRRRQVDLVLAAEEQLLHASDERQFERAISLGRTLVTGDHDFLGIAQKRLASGGHFPGIIFIQPAAPVGAIVQGVLMVATVLTEAEMMDRIEWVPL
jgi:hypothetical protein